MSINDAVYTNINDAADWRARAERHRPEDPAELAREVNRLRAGGWTVRDIEIALRLAPGAIRPFLEQAA